MRIHGVVLALGVMVGLGTGTILQAQETGPRGAPAVHLWYTAPDSLAYYNEVTVQESRPGTYFCVCGFKHGYFGIQESSRPGQNIAIFSVWDPGKQNNPNQVAEDQRVKVIYGGEGVRIIRFGNEGTGGQSTFTFDWKVGQTVRCLVRAKVQGRFTTYSAFIFLPDEKTWKHLASFQTITEGDKLKGYYSFVEDFRRTDESGKQSRRALYGNGWVQDLTGRWLPLTEAMFTANPAPRMDIDAGVDSNRFYLQTGGDTQNKTALKSKLTVPAAALTQPKGLPNYIPASTQEEMQASRNSIDGLMIGIGVEMEIKSGQLMIKRVLEDSPAAKAGLKDGQSITAINGTTTGSMKIEDAAGLIRGAAGTEVELTIVEAGGIPRKVNIRRDTIVVTGVRARMLESKIGLLTVSQINKETAGRVGEALKNFIDQTSEGVILDLRDNEGGWYAGVCQIAGMLAGNSVPLWLVRETGKSQATAVQGEGEKIWNGPLVVLINGKTGGGAELLAAGLQASGRAKLLGQKTAGTASMGKLNALADGGAVRETIGTFFTVADQAIFGVGIKPDIPLEAGVSAEQAIQKAEEVLKKR
jgi:C-terminal peptidase prc